MLAVELTSLWKPYLRQLLDEDTTTALVEVLH